MSEKVCVCCGSILDDQEIHTLSVENNIGMGHVSLAVCSNCLVDNLELFDREALEEDD